MSQDHGRPRKPKRPPPRAQAANPEKTGERIAKVMARVGLCSRRDAEAWIAEGRVSVNGTVLTSPATNIGPEDKVEVDGKPLAQRQRTRLFLFNKPRGLVTTNKDPEGRQTIFDYLAQHHPDAPRLVSVGRLDINTEGLLLLTNDGGLARVLELPSTGWLRRYRVRANGETDQAQLDTLKNGVTIEGIHYAGIDATLDRVQGANSWLTMALREGKNREIKRVLEHFRLEVNRLIRLSFGPFQLGDLADGGLEEVRSRVLRDQLGETLLRESGADLDAPLTAEAEPEMEIEERRPPRNKPVAAQRKMRTNRPAPEPEADKPRHRPLPGPRKHVSALRAQEEAKGPRQRIERATTEDRKGRTVAVERHVLAKPPKKKSRFAEKFYSPAKADGAQKTERPRTPSRPQKTGRPERPERGFAKRPERPEGGRPQRSSAQRPERSATERPEWSATKRSERPAGKRPERNGAERPERSFAKRSERPAGKRPERGTAQRPERSATKRPAEKRAERPTGKRPERAAGKRPARGPQKPGRPDAPRRPPRGR